MLLVLSGYYWQAGAFRLLVIALYFAIYLVYTPPGGQRLWAPDPDYLKREALNCQNLDLTYLIMAAPRRPSKYNA
jgi:hypothetical protein